jgi:phosphoribosylformylglycinamidine cyclo-ligase
MGGLGGFGALFDLSGSYREPVLVSGTDGVGTKLKLAQQLDRHDTIGIDLVAMCVNDVLVQGAEPLFFLDYFATGKLQVDTTVAVVGGIARGCELAGCALIGGETAEMPDMYPPGEYDLAGFCVAAVEKSRLLDGRAVRAGDVLLGIASSGPHSNGYSLVRRIYDRAGRPAELDVGGVRLVDALMAPTTIYVKPMLELFAKHDFHASAHITGGGLTENIIRVIPEGLGLDIEASAIVLPPVFDWLQREGAVPREEMWRTFNCGVGFVLVLAPGDVAAVSARSTPSAWRTARSARWSRAIPASACASRAEHAHGWRLPDRRPGVRARQQPSRAPRGEAAGGSAARAWSPWPATGRAATQCASHANTGSRRSCKTRATTTSRELYDQALLGMAMQRRRRCWCAPASCASFRRNRCSSRRAG